MKNSQAPESDAFSDWSEISTPPFSDVENDWILIKDNDNNTEEEEEEEEEEEDQEQEEEEEEEEEEEKKKKEDKEKKKKEEASSMEGKSSENFMSALIRERILHRLPAKSLLDLRKVSHQWNDFITTPFFIHSQSQSPTTISGVFYHGPPSSGDFSGDTPLPSGVPKFIPFNENLDGLQSPSLKFLPEPVRVLSSSRGLLCCLGYDSGKYFMVNPLTGQWAPLPPPANYHGPNPAAVIVFDEPFVFNFSLDYQLVVVYQLTGDLSGCYGFETFSSKDWEWRVSTELCVTEWVDPHSGVAAGGCAHWRTSMQTVVSYNPGVDEHWAVVWPESYTDGVVWELAEIDQRLNCVCVVESQILVYELENKINGEWKKVRRMENLRAGGERPVRVQEVKELLFVENGWVMAMSLDGGSWRVADGFVHDDDPSMGVVPYVGSLLHVYGLWG